MTAPWTPTTSGTFNLQSWTRGIIRALIEGQRDPATRKEWIMVAYQDGHLSAEEAEDWIVLAGLSSA